MAKKPKCGAPQEEKAVQETDEQTEQATQDVAESTEPIQQEAEVVDPLQAQVEQLSDKLMRTLAEYDNYRKRSQKERMEIYPEAVAGAVTKLLPVLDNFERAMEVQCTDTEFKKGIDMIFASFQEFLKSVNVEEISAQGSPFDPNLHNAVMHIEDDSLEENMVAAVLQKGYKMGDRVLRHAMVQVAN